MYPSTAAGDPAAAAATPVRAGWALFGKHAGQTMDYTILDGSISPVMAEQYIRMGLTAHADDEGLGRAEALPWLSFVGTAGEPATAACVMRVDWSDRRDGTGQVVTPTRLLLIPWEEAARTRTTFFDQARAMKLGWEEVNGAPVGADADGVSLPLHPDHAEVSETAIEQVGPEWAAGVAALLLEGRQVVIAIDRAPMSLGQRLRCLDAVFALLPYAYRARLSAATWASYRVKHTMRLSVAERAVAGQIEVSPDQPPAEPQGPEAIEYLRILRALTSKGLTWRQIVGHLAQQSDPARCRSAPEAVDLLAAMDLSASVYREIVNERGSAVRVAQVLDTFGWEGFETPERQTVVARFLTGAAAGGDGEAQAVVAAQWSAPPVSDEVHRRIQADLTANRVDALRVWFVLAHRFGPGWPQQLLVKVTEMVTKQPTGATVTGWRKLLSDPPAGTEFADPDIHRLFLAHAGATATLLSTFRFDAAGMRGLDALSDLWLATVPSLLRWVSPVIAAVKGNSRFISPALVDMMQTQWPGGVPYVLEAAVTAGHFDTVIVPMVPALAGAMVQSTDHEASILSALRRLLELRTMPSAQSQGYIDALMLVGEHNAPFLNRTRGRPSDAYATALCQVIGLHTVQRRRAAIVDGLMNVLNTDTATAEGTRRAVAMANHVGPELIDRVAPHVSAYCYNHPEEIASLQLGPQWRARLDESLLRYNEFAEHCRAGARGDRIANDLLGLLRNIPPQLLVAPFQAWLTPERPIHDVWLARRIVFANSTVDDRFEEFADYMLGLVYQGPLREPYANHVRMLAEASRSEQDQLKRAERQWGNQRGRSWNPFRW
ncbi:hypothetical protein [Paractinoplanes atraurantiacus]|uniref:Uncharacterized protein n=1 Tax=Paractinoplanes atraurantiacus TaxID=1036182 RepID=A0A285KE25_9ACTN|nr:hypothetical protein [Actinoplanes atraurantiacus]SNY69551.1 hypothetical protein SAMN05421748_13571 [Actinoplanes atraurantiacus]